MPRPPKRLVVALTLLIVSMVALVSAADVIARSSPNGRSPPPDAVTFRYAVIGNSESNAILTHSPDAFHLWESRATLIDRLIQLRLALKLLPYAKTIVMNVNPVEVAVNPACLTFRTQWPIGNEDSRLISARSLVTYAYAAPADVLHNPAKLLDAADRYLALDPVKLVAQIRGTTPPGPPYLPNGSLERHDPHTAPKDVVLDRYSADAMRSCLKRSSWGLGADAYAASILNKLAASADAAGVQLVAVVTPLHPSYRHSLDELLRATLPKRSVSVASLIESLRAMNIRVIDDSSIFDADDRAFLNGDHLSSTGELAYGSLLAAQLASTSGGEPPTPRTAQSN